MNSRVSRSGGGSLQHQKKCGSRVVPYIAVVIAISWCVFIALKIPDGLLLGIMRKKIEEVKTIKETDLVQNTAAMIKAASTQELDVKQYDVLSSTVISSTPALGHNAIHVVFSTDCSFFQDWQTLVVFHSAMAVGQKGEVTRIASGCSEEKKEILSALYSKLFPQYHVHFTPDFKVDKKTNKKYDFYNKPYGVEHWLSNTQIEDLTVIAIIDPDMIFVRPLTINIKEDNLILMDNTEEGY